MEKTIYMVRHADSPYVSGQERTRGLSDKGLLDADQVTKCLRLKPIDRVVSSPYERALATVRGLAEELKLQIEVEEDLRERMLAGSDLIIGSRFNEAKRQLYADFSYSYLGGESSRSAQQRAVSVLNRLLDEPEGRHIVIGTHGDIMTLMLNAFDESYHYGFWLKTSMPDIYQLDFTDRRLLKVTRLWGNS